MSVPILGTESLRSDFRSWLIYDEEVTGAVARGMEAYALSVTGQKLARHPDSAIRGFGNLMVRIGEQRGLDMLDKGGASEVAFKWLMFLGVHLNGGQHDEVKCAQALDELWGNAFHVNSRVTNAGIIGPGVHRQAVRGD